MNNIVLPQAAIDGMDDMAEFSQHKPTFKDVFNYKITQLSRDGKSIESGIIDDDTDAMDGE